jgi:hypothetical protein
MLRTILFLWTALALPAQGGQMTDTPAEVHTSSFDLRWLKSVVSIEHVIPEKPAKPIGTGFLVSSLRDHIVLVTAKHVILDDSGKVHGQLAYRLNEKAGSSSLVRDEELKARSLGAWFLSKDADLACRFVVRRETSDVLMIPSDVFLSQDHVHPGAPAAILGFPLGLRSEDYAQPIIRRAMVASSSPDRLLIDGPSFPGNSGGPVIYVPMIKVGAGLSSPLLNDQRLIGVITEAIAYQEIAISQQTKRPRIAFEDNSGLSIVVPTNSVLDLLNREDVRKLDESIK